MNANRQLHRDAHGDDGFRNAATVLGTLMILIGAPWTFWAYAVSTMVDPTLRGTDWYWAVLERFLGGSTGMFNAASCVVTIVGAASFLAVAMRVRIGRAGFGVIVVSLIFWGIAFACP